MKSQVLPLALVAVAGLALTGCGQKRTQAPPVTETSSTVVTTGAVTPATTMTDDTKVSNPPIDGAVDDTKVSNPPAADGAVDDTKVSNPPADGAADPN